MNSSTAKTGRVHCEISGMNELYICIWMKNEDLQCNTEQDKALCSCIHMYT